MHILSRKCIVFTHTVWAVLLHQVLFVSHNKIRMFAYRMTSKGRALFCFEWAERTLELWLYVAFVPDVSKPCAFVLVNFVALVTSELFSVS